jgi:hypothetical protein
MGDGWFRAYVLWFAGSTASESFYVRTQMTTTLNKIDNIVGAFDGFEKYMYFESSSYVSNSFGESLDIAWPKSTSTKPYVLYGSNTTQVENWLSGILDSASFYDNNNSYSLRRLVPEHIQQQESQVVEKSLDYLLNSVIPVKVQNWLKANQNTEITSLAVGRTPIKQWINTALNILSAGQWSKVKSDVGYDKLYHLYIIINNKWIVENNEVFNIKPYTRPSDEEKIEIPVNGTTTIGEFFANVKNPENFYSNYDAFKNNCQSAALYLLQVNSKVVNTES